jgi:uncharacterized protein YaaN involved in tellurite resistance
MKQVKQQTKKSTVSKTVKSYKKLILEERSERILKYGATLDDCLEWLSKQQQKATKKNLKIEKEIIGKLEYYIKERLSK